MVVSPEIFVPTDLDRDGLEHFRKRIETLLNRLTGEAETWAASGHRKVGQYRLKPGPVQPWGIRLYRPASVCSESWPDEPLPPEADAA